MAKLGGVANSDNNGSAAEWIFDPGQSLGTLKKWMGGGKDMGGTPVGDAYARLTRDQWYTYVNTFVPIENKLIQYATDPTVVSGAMQNASEGVAESFDAAQAGAGRRLRGMGISLSADEQGASNRSYGLAKSLADVGAQNNARDLTRSRQQSLLGNPAPDAIQI